LRVKKRREEFRGEIELKTSKATASRHTNPEAYSIKTIVRAIEESFR